jgi:hypothetical protein
VLETAIGPVLALPLGKLRAARWDSAVATAEGTQDPAPDRAAGQGLATSPMALQRPAQQAASQARPLPRRGSWGGLRSRPCPPRTRSESLGLPRRQQASQAPDWLLGDGASHCSSQSSGR